uniref:(California timema) hypothetical protein n=1 Tax=Timema californicum TaxID=61474 RepID=A0A7R9JF68_TIMCA|nr:unnamed protein product [Timema californicum]
MLLTKERAPKRMMEYRKKDSKRDQKRNGTRFRPLSLDIPKPLFPVAGLPMIQHHIEACADVPNLKEILILGYYPTSELSHFVAEMMQEYKVNVRYLQEFTALGTAGGIYHFRDQIRSGNPQAFFVLNGDVCADFPLVEMLEFHQQTGNGSLRHPTKCDHGTGSIVGGTESGGRDSGCLMTSWMEPMLQSIPGIRYNHRKTRVNTSVVMDGSIETTRAVDGVGSAMEAAVIHLEKDILMPLAGTGKVFAMQTNTWWSQLKTAGSTIYANRHFLELFRTRHRERLVPNGDRGEGEMCRIIGDVHIHPTATVHCSATLGPNVSVGPGCVIGAGVRIRESIVLAGANISDHSLVLHSIVGRDSRVGQWTRVEGTPCDPNPNKPFAKMDNPPLFNSDGRLNPSITILGKLRSLDLVDNTRLQRHCPVRGDLVDNTSCCNVICVLTAGCSVTDPVRGDSSQLDCSPIQRTDTELQERDYSLMATCGHRLLDFGVIMNLLSYLFSTLYSHPSGELNPGSTGILTTVSALDANKCTFVLEKRTFCPPVN